MGLFDFLGGKKDSGRDVGNSLNLSPEDEHMAQGQLGNLMRYQSDPNIVDPLKGTQTATNEVQNNGILGQLYGQGGTLSRTAGEEQNLASRGFSLQPEDNEAYGQASGNITRQFGHRENNLAQALASRGLSNSAAAGMSFSGMQGNKMEQLGQMQRQIADDRMKSNMARLGQTRQFLGQMGAQAGKEIGAQNDRQLAGDTHQFNQLLQKNSAAQGRLGAQASQANENLSQRQHTEQQQGWASMLQGIGNHYSGQDLMSMISGNAPQDTSPKSNMSDDGGAGQAQAGKKSGMDPKQLTSMIA